MDANGKHAPRRGRLSARDRFSSGLFSLAFEAVGTLSRHIPLDLDLPFPIPSPRDHMRSLSPKQRIHLRTKGFLDPQRHFGRQCRAPIEIAESAGLVTPRTSAAFVTERSKVQ